MKLELIPVLRYWDYNTKEISSVLMRLQEQRVSTIAAWVPWAQVELDRNHLLQKFVRQALAMGFNVRLGITPELGIGYPNGGIPEELVRDRQNLAQDRLGQHIYACAPPSIHPLVSLLAPPVFQRYGHFLLKLAQELNDTLTDGAQGILELLVTDSFFKHYRNAGLPPADHGDFSLRHLNFMGGLKKDELTPILAEKIFHSRAMDFLKSRFGKSRQVKVISKNVFTHESSLGRLLEEMMGTGPNYSELFKSLCRARSSCGMVWFDYLGELRDKERNYLVSSALIIYEELWISETDFQSLSPSFRKKLEKISETFEGPETELSQPAIAFVSNRFSPARISCILREQLGTGIKFKDSLNDLTDREREKSKLFVVEEGFPLEFKLTNDIFSLAKDRDCTVVIFRSSLCEAGLKEFHKLKNFRLNHGWIFEIGLYPGGGHVLLIEGHENSQLSMESLGESLLSAAKIDPLCSYDKKNSEIFTLAIDWDFKNEPSSSDTKPPNMKTLFLMNSSSHKEKLNLDFTASVKIQGLEVSQKLDNPESGATGNSFEAELPPLSVIPISVFIEQESAVSESRITDGIPAELA